MVATLCIAFNKYDVCSLYNYTFKIALVSLSGYIFSLFTKDEMLASGSGKEIDEGFHIGRQNDLNQNYQEETEKLRSTSSGGKL